MTDVPPPPAGKGPGKLTGLVSSAGAAPGNVRSAAVNSPLADTHAKRLVLMCVVGTGVMTGVASVHRGDGLPPARVVGGVVVAGVLLAGVAEFQPKIAAGLAAVMLLTATVGMGTDAAGGITDITRKRKPKPTTKPAGGGGGSPMRPA